MAKSYMIAIVILIGCASTNKAIDSSILAKLNSVEQSPETEGILIYEGSVFAIDDQNPKQVFSYERRVREEKEILIANHITRNMDKKVIITQIAKYVPKYQLKNFEYINGQVGYIAKVEVNRNLVRYSLTDNSGNTTSSEEEVNEPLVVGPTLFGFISTNWETLSAGNSLFVQFIVAEQKKTYRFEIRRLSENNGITRFEMKATNWLIGLFIKPFQFDFDSSKHTIITYQGRVPPMRSINGQLKELDARVTYVHRSNYR